jgi:delta-aminolevulinic acid dehydratase/porphobilinogen synthase
LKRNKSKIYNKSINKSKVITDLLASGMVDIHELKRELDYITSKDNSLSYIKKMKSEFFKQFRTGVVDKVVDNLPQKERKTLKENIIEAMEHVAEQTKNIKEPAIIGDLFKTILQVGGGK